MTAINRVILQAERQLSVFETLPKALDPLLKQQAEFYSFSSRIGSEVQHAAAKEGVMGGTLEIVKFLSTVEAWKKFARNIVQLQENYVSAISKAK